MTESNRIEYKRELTDSLEKEVVAFMNYHGGGVIYIGIDNNGSHYKLDDLDGLQLKIKDRIKNNILPSTMGLFDVAAEYVKGGEVIKITVASDPEKPYYIRKNGMSERGCFIRAGSSAEPMTPKMIEEFFSKRTRNSIGKIRSPKKDLSFEQLKIYYQEKGKPLNEKFAYNLELKTEDGYYNYAAYLMSDVNNVSIKLAKYSSLTRAELIENNEYGYCSLIKSAKQILDKLELENKTMAKITHKERIEKHLYEPRAVRESVINALVHNDYSNEVPPKFELFPDRLEITSAGGLPCGLAQNEFFEGYSAPRNKELMRIFKDLDLVEHLGSGIPRILEKYSADIFGFSDNFLRVTFKADTSVTEGLVDGLVDRLVKKFEDDLGERHIELLRLIESKPDILIRELAEELGVSTTSIDKYIKFLKDRGYISRAGNRKSGYWKIK